MTLRDIKMIIYVDARKKSKRFRGVEMKNRVHGSHIMERRLMVKLGDHIQQSESTGGL